MISATQHFLQEILVWAGRRDLGKFEVLTFFELKTHKSLQPKVVGNFLSPPTVTHAPQSDYRFRNCGLCKLSVAAGIFCLK
jgi:hypothetical protein